MKTFDEFVNETILSSISSKEEGELKRKIKDNIDMVKSIEVLKEILDIIQKNYEPLGLPKYL